MKKYTLFILLILLCGAIALSAQETLRSAFLDNAVHAIPLDNEEMLVLAHVGDFYSSQRAYRVDKQGNVLNEYVNLFGGNVIEEVVVGADNSVFLLGWSGSCDFAVEPQLNKFDIEGNLLWTKPTHLQARVYPVLNTMVNGPEGGVLMHDPYDSPKTWALYDSIGTLVNSEWVSGELESAYNSDNGNFVYLNTYEVGFVGVDNVIVLSSYDNTAYLYDNQLNLLHTVQIDNLYTTETPAVASNDEYIYIAADNKLLRLDYNLQIINEIEFTYGKMKAISATATHINIIGNDSHYTYIKRGSSQLDFSNFSVDVGVVEILSANIDTIACGYEIYGYCYYGGCSYSVNNIKVVVENLGPLVVIGYEINAYYPDDCPLYCNEDRSVYREDYGGVLMPGERDTVDFPSMSLRLEDFLDICPFRIKPLYSLGKPPPKPTTKASKFKKVVTASIGKKSAG